MGLAGGAVEEVARAKVNLHLHVTGRRADGYHLLDSLAVFPDIGDRLTAAPAQGLSLSVVGPFSEGLSAGADNLVMRAAETLRREAGIGEGAALTLDKRLPVASGIGGGSADAAAALRALNRLWELGLDGAALREVAAGLGADVPVCLGSTPQRMAGVGEIVTPVRLPGGFHMALVNPGVAVATPDVFRALDRRGSPEAPPIPEEPDAFLLWLEETRNDLEPPAISLAPQIEEALALLRAAPGAVIARMSGSGATCFGLFREAEAAASAAAGARERGWWGASGPMT